MSRFTSRTARRLEAVGGEQGATADELELASLRRELNEAREAIGLGWLAGGASLAEAIRRKVRLLEAIQRPLPRARKP